MTNKEITYKECQTIWEDPEVKVHSDLSEDAMMSIASYITMVLKINKADNILDIGCGDGRLDFYLKKQANELHGIDFSKSKLEEAKKRNTEVSYYEKSFLDNIELGGINKVYSYSVMQYCKPEDIRTFFEKQFNLVGGVKSQDKMIVHLDVPDLSKALLYYKRKEPDISDDYIKENQNKLRTIFDDGSYWHNMNEVRNILSEWKDEIESVQINPARYWDYRSDIIIKLK